MLKIRVWGAAAALAGLLSVASAAVAVADQYPSRPIRVILGPTPESTPRLITEWLQRELGQAVVLEPRLGAGGEIAAKTVASADPDGYTLFYASSNMALATAMQLGSFNFATDFEPIGLTGKSAYVLVAAPELPVKTPAELIALAKAKPGELNCASSGMATPGHLSCEMFKGLAGVNIVHVPFRSAAASMNAIVSSQVQFAVTVSTAARGQLEAGAIRGLAVTTPEPSPLVPGLPALKETIPGFVVHGWGALVAPKGTPKPIIDKIAAAFQRVRDNPEVKEKLFKAGLAVAEPHTPEEFGAFVRSEIDRWNKTIDAAGVKRGKPM